MSREAIDPSVARHDWAQTEPLLRAALQRGAIVALQRPDGLYVRVTELDPTALGRYVVVDDPAQRQFPPRSRPTDAEIVQHYQDRQISGQALAKAFGIDSNIVYAAIRAAGVSRPRGPMPGWKRPPRPPRLVPPAIPRRARRSTVTPEERETRREVARRAANERNRLDYKAVYKDAIKPIALRDDHLPPKPPPSPSYANAYSSAVRNAFADAWWQKIVWTKDSLESDARIICDLCGESVVSYYSSGGLVTCHACWKATATDDELAAYRDRMRERARVHAQLNRSTGQGKFEFKARPNPASYPPLGPPNLAQSERSIARFRLLLDAAQVFGVPRERLFRATSASCRAALAAGDRYLLVRIDGTPLFPKPQVQQHQVDTAV